MISCWENNHSVVFHNVVKKTTDLSRENFAYFSIARESAQMDTKVYFLYFRLTFD